MNFNRSKRLAYLLRHDRVYDFEDGGWRTVADLHQFHSFTAAEIFDIVSRDDKGRFEFNSDKTKIRALYGHSIKIDLLLSNVIPPHRLFHGTALKYIESIKQSGLKPQSRQFVHLTEMADLAVKTGARHGQPILLCIDSYSMCENGYHFYKINNGTWLTNEVPVKYISFINDTTI